MRMEPGANPQPSESVLATADELARGLVAAAAPIQFDTARDDNERLAVYRLRYQVVIERGWAQPDTFPDGLERDSYDEAATHIVGWAGSGTQPSLAATARLVLPGEGVLLPTEAAFDLQVTPRGQVADMGRQIVARDYSSMRHKVFAALLAKTWLEMRARGYWLVCGDFSPTMMRLYRMLGFAVAPLGPAREFWGEERAPILVDIAGSVPRLVERWGKA
jgi:N-acyl-L-homoserine lactone synthetase